MRMGQMFRAIASAMMGMFERRHEGDDRAAVREFVDTFMGESAEVKASTWQRNRPTRRRRKPSASERGYHTRKVGPGRMSSGGFGGVRAVPIKRVCIGEHVLAICSACDRTRPVSEFGLRTDLDGTFRIQSVCHDCRSLA